jgi:hypothetical protein
MLDALDGAPCAYCGGDWFVDVFEIWPEDRAVQLEACCEGAHEEACLEIEALWERGDWQALLAEYGVDVRTVHTDVEKTHGQWTLDWGLELGEISRDDAKAFIAKHHRHNAPPVSWRWGHAVYNGPDLVAVAMVGRPVARRIDAGTTVEITRLCVDPTLPAGLVEHACSKLYGAAAREAEKRGFEKVITYTLESERGTSLTASGYVAEATSAGGRWDRDARRRAEKAPTCPKVRWARALRPKARAVAERKEREAARQAERAAYLARKQQRQPRALPAAA